MKAIIKILIIGFVLTLWFSACNRDKIMTKQDYKRQKVDTFYIDELYGKLNSDPINEYKMFRDLNSKTIIKGKDTIGVSCLFPGSGIYSYTFFGFDTAVTNSRRDYILLGSKKVIIDSLIWGINVENSLFVRTPSFTSYLFAFNEKEYIASFAQDCAVSSNRPNIIFILFEKSGEDFDVIFSDYEASDTILCLGDINNDNNLDYIQLALPFTSDSLYLLSLRNQTFVRDDDYFVVIESMSGFGQCIVDKTNSHWKGYNW